MALTFNVKPVFPLTVESVSSHQNSSLSHTEKINERFAEWDTWETIHAVESALSLTHNVTLVEANNDCLSTFLASKPDIVFNIAEGMYGISREAQIPAILDMLNIPYTGSDPLTLATCLDKARTKEILSYYNIPNPKFLLVNSVNELTNFSLSFPVVAKPDAEGSSKGVFSSSFCTDMKSLSLEVERALVEYEQPVLIEEFLPGREFTVAMMGNGNRSRVLPIIEISYDDFPKDFVPLYSYEAKWILDSKENQLDIYKCPAPIDARLELAISSLCMRTYSTLRCRDWSRIDVRLDSNGIPNIIEINPLPGILPDPKENSCYPKAARTAGMSYNEMLLNVLNEARLRYGI